MEDDEQLRRRLQELAPHGERERERVCVLVCFAF